MPVSSRERNMRRYTPALSPRSGLLAITTPALMYGPPSFSARRGIGSSVRSTSRPVRTTSWPGARACRGTTGAVGPWPSPQVIPLPALVLVLLQGDRQQLLRGDAVFEAGRCASLAEIFERVVHRLGRSVEGLMPLQGNAHSMGRQETSIRQGRRCATQ